MLARLESEMSRQGVWVNAVMCTINIVIRGRGLSLRETTNWSEYLRLTALIIPHILHKINVAFLNKDFYIQLCFLST